MHEADKKIVVYVLEQVKDGRGNMSILRWQRLENRTLLVNLRLHAHRLLDRPQREDWHQSLSSLTR